MPEAVWPPLAGDAEAEMLGLLAPDGVLADVIVRAAYRACRTGRREHIKANRCERVGLFVTDLRREITAITCLCPENRNYLLDALCDKKVWYDVGVPQAAVPLSTHTSRSGRLMRITHELLAAWCQHVALADDDVFGAGMVALRLILDNVDGLLRDAGHINAAAGLVADGLVALDRELADLS